MNDYERKVFEGLEKSIEKSADILQHKQELLDVSNDVLKQLKQENDRAETILKEMRLMIIMTRGKNG